MFVGICVLNRFSNHVSHCQRNCIKVLESLTIHEVEEYFPGFKAFIDSAEQEIPRPKNKRTDHFSRDFGLLLMSAICNFVEFVYKVLAST
jgi:hypothetical protein